MLHRIKCSQRPNLEYKIVLKEIYDDWYSKKTVSRRIRRLARYFTPYSSSVSFAPYSSSVMLFRGVFVVRDAAAHMTNLRHH
jgi:hypothetical protein